MARMEIDDRRPVQIPEGNTYTQRGVTLEGVDVNQQNAGLEGVTVRGRDGHVDVFNLQTTEGQKAYLARLQSLGIRPSDLPSFVTNMQAHGIVTGLNAGQLAMLHKLAANIAWLATHPQVQHQAHAVDVADGAAGLTSTPPTPAPGATPPPGPAAPPFQGGITTIQSQWADFVAQSKAGNVMDVTALVEFVLRESYLQTTQDLGFYAQKVKFFNALKKCIRDELTRLRTAQSFLAGCWKPDGTLDVEKLHTKANPNNLDANGNPINYDPNVFPWQQYGNCNSATSQASLHYWLDVQLTEWHNGGGAKTFSETPGPNGEVTVESRTHINWSENKDVLENAIKGLEEKLSGVGDDAQLANVDLQNVLQKQQQTLQMMSNISKMLHDTALSIIRKMGG